MHKHQHQNHSHSLLYCFDFWALSLSLKGRSYASSHSVAELSAMDYTSTSCSKEYPLLINHQEYEVSVHEFNLCLFLWSCCCCSYHSNHHHHPPCGDIHNHIVFGISFHRSLRDSAIDIILFTAMLCVGNGHNPGLLNSRWGLKLDKASDWTNHERGLICDCFFVRHQTIFIRVLSGVS